MRRTLGKARFSNRRRNTSTVVVVTTWVSMFVMVTYFKSVTNFVQVQEGKQMWAKNPYVKKRERKKEAKKGLRETYLHPQPTIVIQPPIPSQPVLTTLAAVKIKLIPERERERVSIKNCLLNDGPVPVILMSRGRSGSGSTWQMMTKLTGKETPSYEYTGKDSHQSNHFFEGIGPNEGGKWMMDYLCACQKRDGNAGVVGFKWKPYLSIYKDAAQAALRLISRQAKNGEGLPVRVVRSRRNPLDVYLSKLKHQMPTKTKAHCLKGDTKCVEEHKKVIIAVPDVHKLYKYLHRDVDQEDAVDKMLKELEVPTIFVSYEKLYFPVTPKEGVKEWKKIFSFLGNIGPGGKSNLSWRDIKKAMGHESTSVQRHADKIANFEEVDAALRNTNLNHLIQR